MAASGPPERGFGRAPRHLGEALARLARELGMPDVQASASVAGAWAEAVGPEVAAHVSPVRLRDGVLIVRADSPGWGSQMRYLAGSLIGQLNAVLGEETVREIHVRVGAERGHEEGGESPSKGRWTGRG